MNRSYFCIFQFLLLSSFLPFLPQILRIFLFRKFTSTPPRNLLARNLSVVQTKSSVCVRRLDVRPVQVDVQLKGPREEWPVDFAVVDATQDGSAITV